MSRWQVSEIGVDALPYPCRACLFWEAGGVPGTKVAPREREAAQVAKESWWQATALEWGPAGLAAWDGESLQGYVLIAPALYLRGAPRFGRVTDDALLLATLWVSHEAASDQVAGTLVEAGLRLAAAQGAHALEAFGSRDPGEPCVPSESVLQSCGFQLLEHRIPYPHYRLDLGQTARWAERVEDALAGVQRLLRGRRRLGRVPSLPSTLITRK